jgi:hypothetical protein
VICGKEIHALISVKASSQSRDWRLGSQKCLGGKGAQGTYKSGGYGSQLTPEERDTCVDLIGFWVSISRRAALNDVANVDIFSGQVNGPKDPGEELAGLTHKRVPLNVLLVARPLAHEDQLCPGISVSKDDILPALVQFASPAGPKIISDHVEAFCHARFVPTLQNPESFFREDNAGIP